MLCKYTGLNKKISHIAYKVFTKILPVNFHVGAKQLGVNSMYICINTSCKNYGWKCYHVTLLQYLIGILKLKD